MAVSANWRDTRTFMTSAVQSRRLAHAYVLAGRHHAGMYQLALDMAQLLNCETPNRPSPAACGQCQNCRWIEANAHPAVLTISRLTYQVSDKGGDLSLDDLEKQAAKSQPTQIKTEQVARLIQQLGVSSPYYRVVIFTDAEELPATAPSRITPPREWQALEANADKSFHIRPLDARLFNASAANRFLKTLEEPPPRTLFFFISETPDQLLATIVSRCQVLPFQACGEVLPENNYPPEETMLWDELMTGWQRRQDPYQLLRRFNEFWQEERQLSPVQALNRFQQYLRLRFASGLDEAAVFQTHREAQSAVEEAIRKLQAKTHAEQTMADLFFRLYRLFGA